MDVAFARQAYTTQNIHHEAQSHWLTCVECQFSLACYFMLKSWGHPFPGCTQYFFTTQSCRAVPLKSHRNLSCQHTFWNVSAHHVTMLLWTLNKIYNYALLMHNSRRPSKVPPNICSHILTHVCVLVYPDPNFSSRNVNDAVKELSSGQVSSSIWAAAYLTTWRHLDQSHTFAEPLETSHLRTSQARTSLQVPSKPSTFPSNVHTFALHVTPTLSEVILTLMHSVCERHEDARFNSAASDPVGRSLFRPYV